MHPYLPPSLGLPGALCHCGAAAQLPVLMSDVTCLRQMASGLGSDAGDSAALLGAPISSDFDLSDMSLNEFFSIPDDVSSPMTVSCVTVDASVTFGSIFALKEARVVCLR